MDLGANQAPGIGSTGMISTDSPGKIVKCGCFSNSLAAASCDSARTIVKAYLVADVLDPALRNLLGLAERPAHGLNRRLMLFGPGFPGGHALLFLGAPFGFGKRHPGLHARAGLAAEKDGEISIVRSHTVSFPLRSWASVGRDAFNPHELAIHGPRTNEVWSGRHGI